MKKLLFILFFSLGLSSTALSQVDTLTPSHALYPTWLTKINNMFQEASKKGSWLSNPSDGFYSIYWPETDSAKLNITELNKVK